MDKLPDDIAKAKKLFSDFEKISPRMKTSKFSKFIEAIRLLDSYLKDNFHSSHFELIENLKKSNVRSLLSHLKELNAENYADWFNMRIDMLLYIQNTINQVLISNPELKSYYKNFIGLYHYEFKEGCQRIIKTLQDEIQKRQI